MLKLKFHTYLITMQNVNTGLYRTFFLQAEAAGQFWGFVSVLPLFSLSKCEVPNFGPLYSKLGELNIQNSLACFTYNIPGTSSSNFIGFWGIDIWADFEGTRPSCTPVRPSLGVIHNHEGDEGGCKQLNNFSSSARLTTFPDNPTLSTQRTQPAEDWLDQRKGCPSLPLCNFCRFSL